MLEHDELRAKYDEVQALFLEQQQYVTRLNAVNDQLRKNLGEDCERKPPQQMSYFQGAGDPRAVYGIGGRGQKPGLIA
ncbi:hypothetical protein T35B1_04853 [Salinisphaera shabanensis T35B1]|uniref:hypothetical protein n=1 Tax=Salinisphaera shabanensis TaxID=180542 RepID=UPI00333EF26F